MSTTYTTNAGLGVPNLNDTNYVTTFSTTFNLLDGIKAIGALAVNFTEHPSASLNVAIAGGSYRKSDGTIVTYAGSASQAMTASNTNYLYLTDAGVLTINTTGFPASTNMVPLATVVAGGSSITSITDSRIPFISCGAATTAYLPLAGGTLSDPANIALGTTTGTQFGTAISQKLAFYGSTAITQRTNANQVALTDSTGGTASTTFAAITAGSSYAQADIVAIKNALAQAVLTINELRQSLVSLGLIKGS
jgi:hypothetical protein